MIVENKMNALFAGKRILQPPDNLLENGTVIDNRWKVQYFLVAGSFGNVYKVLDTKHPTKCYAMKIEKLTQVKGEERFSSLNVEVYVMKRLLQKSAKCCPSFKCYGFDGGITNGNFIVMDLLGKNLARLKHRMPLKKFSLETCLHVGRSTLKCIEEMHNFGFLHRDIKPSNFAIGKTDPQSTYIFDFGCSREFKTNRGELKGQRDHVTMFKGTPLYASVNALYGRDAGRVDDLWSWFFMLIEFTVGRLPWAETNANFPSEDSFHYISRLALIKSRLLTDYTWLLSRCPVEYIQIYNHLLGLKFEDQPKYEMLHQTLNVIAERNGFLRRNKTMHLDWEVQ